MRLAKPLAAMTASMLLVAATQPGESNRVNLFGVSGAESCASWLSTPQKESEGFTWMMGYWSGLNMMSSETGNNGMVGGTSDGQGIAAEVKRVCAQQPSLLLVNATQTVLERFKSEGR